MFETLPEVDKEEQELYEIVKEAFIEAISAEYKG